VSEYFTSRPTSPDGDGDLMSGLPSVGCIVTSATVYGSSSRRLSELVIVRPPRSPNDET
jgi:hypothetical protein